MWFIHLNEFVSYVEIKESICFLLAGKVIILHWLENSDYTDAHPLYILCLLFYFNKLHLVKYPAAIKEQYKPQNTY